MKRLEKRSILRLAVVVLSALMLLGALAVASFAADVAETRYQIGGGDWTEATFVDAIKAVDGKTAIIELQKDVTLTAGVEITGGDITVQSTTAGSDIYAIKRGSAFATSVFTMKGGKMTFKNVTLDGQQTSVAVNGAMFSMASGTNLILDNGTTLKDSYSSVDGGAVWSKSGKITMNGSAQVLGAVGRKGGAFYLEGTGAALTMNGGLIKGCSTVGNTSIGAAVYLSYSSVTLTMNGGEITENESNRTYVSNATAQGENSFVDGAIGSAGTVVVKLSGNAKIHNNKGRLFVNGVAASASTVGADIVPGASHRASMKINIEDNFSGLVGIANAETAAIATVSTNYAVGTVIYGIYDGHNPNHVAKVTESKTVAWAPFEESEYEVRYQIDGGVWEKGSFEDAIAAVGGNTVIIELLKDVTLSKGLTVAGGNVTVQSYPLSHKIYAIKKGGAFAAPLFTMNGGDAGLTLTFKDITLDGQGSTMSAKVNGAMFLLSSAKDKLVFDGGTTIQNSYTSGQGGVVYATLGTIDMKDGVTIKGCSASKGGAFALSGTVTLNMSGGLITECVVPDGDWNSGAAVYMEKNPIFNMSGGVITGNKSGRKGGFNKHQDNSLIDGAVAAMPNKSYTGNRVNLSGDAVIWNNMGYRYDKDTNTYAYDVGGDLVCTVDHHWYALVNIAADFTGLVGFSSDRYIAYPKNPECKALGQAGEGLAAGTVISGLVDTINHNVAIVKEDGSLAWTPALIEVETDDGLVRRYTDLASALATAGAADKATVTLFSDLTLTDGVAITGGDITIQSKGDSIYTVYRGFATNNKDTDKPCFTLSGAKVTLKNITLDGNSINGSNKVKANGAMIAMSSANDTVILENGATIQNSYANDAQGGAIYAPIGTVEMRPGSVIKGCTAKKGGAISLGYNGKSSATFNMTGGVITDCAVYKGSLSNGAAVFMEYYSTFNMSGGLITKNTSGRNAPGSGLPGTMIDGAVVALRNRDEATRNIINVSGDAVIRDNSAFKINADGTASDDYVLGADVVYSVGALNTQPYTLVIAEGFAGSVGLAYSTSPANTPSMSVDVAATVEDTYAFGAVVPTLIDNLSTRVAKLQSNSRLMGWTDAVAEVDYNGKITRYTSLEEAYAVVGDKAPIKLLANVTDVDLFIWKGQSVKLILNGYTVNFAAGAECTSTTATEQVGAFTYEGYTYEGKDAEVTTYTATKVTHICDTKGADYTTPAFCSCGKLSAFPTDAAKNVRYSIDGGSTWTYAALSEALTKVSGQTAIIELYRDITLTDGITVSSELTFRSLPTALNGVDGDKIYTILRGAGFTTSMFTIDGGKLTFADITVDGNGKNVTATADGAIVLFKATAKTTDKVTFDHGTVVQNSKTTKSGSVVWAKYGHVVMNDGAVIQNCQGAKGGAIYLGGDGSDDTTLATFTMTGGIITGCTASGSYGHGAALYMTGSASFKMSGGVITGNISERTSMMGEQEDGVFVDGAVGFLYGSRTKIYISGDATIRNNYGRICLDRSANKTSDLVFGGDIVLHAKYRDPKTIEIAADFTGSIGISYPSTGKIGSVAASYEEGTILNGIIDANNGNVAKVNANGELVWTPAEAEIDVNGKILRYETVDEAYALVGTETPIKLVSDASITLNTLGQTAKIVENNHKLFVVSESGFEKSDGEKIILGTFTVGEHTILGYEVEVFTYTVIESGSVTNVALAAGTDLSLYFYANIGSKFADAILRVTREGQSVDLKSTYDENLRQYCFVYRDIAPQCAGDNISVELICDGRTFYTFDGYSVALYCKQVLAMSANSLGLTNEKGIELKTLLRDLLTYCASAQVYRNYKTDALVNEGIEGSEYVLPSYNPKNFVVNNAVDGVTFTEAGLRFYTDNRLWFTFETPDVANTTLTIGSKTYTSKDFDLVSGNTYICYAEALRATQFDSVFTAKLYFGETLVQTGTYSVNAYVQSLVTATPGTYTEAEIALAKATYNYGVAARMYWGSHASKAYTVKETVNTYGGKTVGGATLDGTALMMQNVASGIEFAFRGKDDVILNITATEASRIEVTVDGQAIVHFLVNEGTADYTVKGGLADGKHTIRVVTENGELVLNSISIKGYFTATEADAKDLYIEFVGDDVIFGRNIFLNYSTYEDDATDAYAVLAARELGAKYLISATDKKFTASANTPDLVVIEYKNGVDYTKLLANVRAAYGAGVKILFVGVNEKVGAMAEDFVNLTADTTGIDGYPSAGGSAIQGAELAKYIRENSGFFTAEEIAEAKTDIIVEVEATNATSGYNSFHVYVKTSDPSGKYYIRYNFTHQYSTVRDNYDGNSCTNISNFRIIRAEVVEVTGFNGTKVLYNVVTEALGSGEISTAIKTDGSEDFTGGFHGDEWIRGIGDVDGHLGDQGWIPNVTLLADGKEVDVVGGEKALVFCNTLTFDQRTMMYEYGTSSNDPTDVIAKRGNPLTTHSQHFTITRESGVHNRQSYEWQKEIQITTNSNYMLMFTLNRIYNGVEVCTEVEAFNADGGSNGQKSIPGPLVGDSYGLLQNATNRAVHYGGEAGVSSYIRYDLCNVEEFSANKATIVDIWINVRGNTNAGDNKFYARFKSAAGNNVVSAGEFWTIDAAYGIDYVTPNN